MKRGGQETDTAFERLPGGLKHHERSIELSCHLADLKRALDGQHLCHWTKNKVGIPKLSLLNQGTFEFTFAESVSKIALFPRKGVESKSHIVDISKLSHESVDRHWLHLGTVQDGDDQFQKG